MKELIKTISRTAKENIKYRALIESAISNIDEAINSITYSSNLIDCDTGKNINQELINNLNDLIYKLEDYEYSYVYKPYILKE